MTNDKKPHESFVILVSSLIRDWSFVVPHS
jgi:hypothetical protein